MHGNRYTRAVPCARSGTTDPPTFGPRLLNNEPWTKIELSETREYKWMKIENRSGRKSKREYKWMKIENTSGRKSKREYKWMKIENRIENRKYNSMKIENRVENRKYNSMKSALLGHRISELCVVSFQPIVVLDRELLWRY